MIISFMLDRNILVSETTAEKKGNWKKKVGTTSSPLSFHYLSFTKEGFTNLTEGAVQSGRREGGGRDISTIKILKPIYEKIPR